MAARTVALTQQSQSVVSTLSPEQRRIYDEVIGHYRAFLAGANPSPLLINVDGQAGTGILHRHINALIAPLTSNR